MLPAPFQISAQASDTIRNSTDALSLVKDVTSCGAWAECFGWVDGAKAYTAAFTRGR